MPDIFKNIEEQLDTIRYDFRNGCTTITRNALDVFTYSVNILRTVENKEKIVQVAQKLIDSKPSMASLDNVITLALAEFDKLEPPYDFSDAARKIRNNMLLATENTLENALDIVFASAKATLNLITCSYSSTILKLIQKALSADYRFKLFVLESKWQGWDYAGYTIAECQSLGVDCVYVKEKDIVLISNVIDYAIIGADSIHSSGGVINGTPSLKLARYVNEFCGEKAPFYVIAESFKKTDKVKVDEGYDYLTQEYITKIITDDIFDKLALCV